MKKILSLGSINIDHTYYVDYIASEGETISSMSYFKSYGGKGLNQSIAISKSGSLVYHAGKISLKDSYLIDYLKENGINRDLVSLEEDHTGHAIIQVAKDGSNAIIVEPGVNHKISNEFISKSINNFGAGDYIVLQNEISNLNYAIEASHKKGMISILNPSPITESLSMVNLGFVDYLILNEIELLMIAKKETIDEGIEELNKLYPSLKIVLTLGDKGSKYFSSEESFSIESLKIKPIDTSGAGDTFCGYFVSGLSKGLTPLESMKLANVAAGIACTRKGTSIAVPKIEEVEEFIQSN